LLCARYTVLESFGTLSLLRLEPETGRTHQIRVHLAAMGHPVLADPLYGTRKGRALPASGPGRSFQRQALHAAEIRFPHPVTSTLVRLQAPLPRDMRSLLEELRSGKR
jgi:23S rRNA pseudouridine1911/1915/1917 synthase